MSHRRDHESKGRCRKDNHRDQLGASAGVPSIAVTAHAETEEMQRALSAGFQSHVAKPVDALHLVQAIERSLSKQLPFAFAPSRVYSLSMKNLTQISAFVLGLFLMTAASAQAESHMVHIGAFGGVTVDSDHTSPTFGVDGEISPPLFPVGFIGLADFAMGSGNHAVYAGGLTVHPVDELRVLGAAGIETARGHSKFLVRLGANYDLFHFGPVTVGPAAAVDFVAGHKFYVLGVTAGIGL